VTLTEEPLQGLAREKNVARYHDGVKPDGRRLAGIGKIIDDGKLRPLVQAVLPLEQAKRPCTQSRPTRSPGRSS